MPLVSVIAIGDVDAHPLDKPWRFPGGMHTLIYRYESLDYEGRGYALALVRRDGRESAFARSISHCSCYGPWDDGAGKWSRLSAVSKWDLEDVEALLAEAKRLGLDVGADDLDPDCPAPPAGLDSWEV